MQESFEIARQNNSLIGSDFEIENWWNAAWLPLFHNGAGDYICYDTEGVFTGEKGQLIEFWHDGPKRTVMAPQLECMLGLLHMHYQSLSENSDDEYFEIPYPPHFPKNFILQ